MNNESFKHIVVGVDFSKYSKTVVKEAQKLAETMSVPLTYVYIYEYFQTLGGTIGEFENRTKEDLFKAYKLRQDSSVYLKMGDPAAELIDFAKKVEPMPLIIVGHKGHGKVANFLLGSTAEKIATLSPFPVWVHRGSRTLLPKKVLVPSDLTEQTDRTLNRVKYFESSIHPNLELYHVMPQPIAILDYPVHRAMAESLDAEDDKAFAEFTKNHPDLKIARTHGNLLTKIESKAKRFDIVALSPRGKNKRDPLLGKVATKLIRSVNKPILVCP